MWDSIVELILQFKFIILLTVFFGIAIAAAGALLTRGLKWGQKRWKVLGIFFGLNARELLWLSFCLMRYLFFIGVVIFGIELQTAHLYFYVALCLGCMVLLPHIKRVVLDLVSSIVAYGALIVANMLNGYLSDIRADIFISVISALLAIFIIVYMTYFLFKDVSDMLAARRQGEKL